MIDNGLPLPNMDLSDKPNKNISYCYSKFAKIFYCSHCGWFEIKNRYGTQIFFRECCPNCGWYNYKKHTARYKIRNIKKGFWIFTNHESEIIGIELGPE